MVNGILIKSYFSVMKKVAPIQDIPERPLQGRWVVRDDLSGHERVRLHHDSVVGVACKGYACFSITGLS